MDPTAIADPPRRTGLGRIKPPARSSPARPAAATRAAPASDPGGGHHRLPALAEPPANPSWLRSLTDQLRQDLQLPQLQVEVLDLSLGRRASKDSGLDKA